MVGKWVIATAGLLLFEVAAGTSRRGDAPESPWQAQRLYGSVTTNGEGRAGFDVHFVRTAKSCRKSDFSGRTNEQGEFSFVGPKLPFPGNLMGLICVYEQERLVAAKWFGAGSADIRIDCQLTEKPAAITSIYTSTGCSVGY